jgi:choline dehydrogenase-like flavoprotein
VPEHAHYVVVGAGSAGCVVAARLSEDPAVRVTLLEAGGKSKHPNVTIPAAFAKQFKTKLDWDLETEPEPHCDGRTLFVPRGKGLGGSSSMNAMMYVRGRPLEYDLWERDGADGWGWSTVGPYFLKAEDNSRGASEHHAVGGPLRVEDVREPRGLTSRFLDAAEAAGVPRIDDYNGPEQDGVSITQVNQRGGRRWSVADAYLRPVLRRSNLNVVTGATALGVVIADGRATGVRYRDGQSRERVASAEREVILSAGAIGSPQLLMLSGIGPAAHLSEVGVEVARDLPGVGENLQDHPYIVNVWSSSVPESLYGADKPGALVKWLFGKHGPLTSNVGEAMAFVKTRPGLAAADLQMIFAPAYFVNHGFEEFDGHAMTLGSIALNPRSRGTVRLRSADPADKPRILGNTLSDPQDVATMVAGVRLAREIAATEPLASAVDEELFPGPDVESDEDIEADVRRRVELLYHPVGTCRMGTDENAVVDPQLRVRGVEGLRVADASVMPLIPGGNTNAPTIMIGERAADLVRGAAESALAT